MSDELDSFMQLASGGEIAHDEIDDYVDRWHEGAEADGLATFLGMSDEEYALWVCFPEALPTIVAARARHRPLREAMNDNYAQLKFAARAEDASEARRLEQWLNYCTQAS